MSSAVTTSGVLLVSVVVLDVDEPLGSCVEAEVSCVWSVVSELCSVVVIEVVVGIVVLEVVLVIVALVAISCVGFGSCVIDVDCGMVPCTGGWTYHDVHVPGGDVGIAIGGSEPWCVCA